VYSVKPTEEDYLKVYMLKMPAMAALDIYGRMRAENWWNVIDRGKETYCGKKTGLRSIFSTTNLVSKNRA
jgi:hypothetical protein